MSVLEVTCWVAVLALSVWGIAAKDWRASIGTLAVSVLAIVLMIVHAWR